PSMRHATFASACSTPRTWVDAEVEKNRMRRVVITGLGIVSSIGVDADAVTASLREARPGVEFAPEYAELGFRCQVHAPSRIDWESMVDRRAARFLASGTAYAHIAMEQAVGDAR